MAKKNKDEVPNPNSVANRDILQRLNFLYQASTYLNSVSPTNSSTCSPSAKDGTTAHPSSSDGGPLDMYRRARKRENKRIEARRKRHPATAADLSRSYAKTMKLIGQKTVVRLDPSVKRTICKNCNTIMIPGATATVRVKPSASHGKLVRYTCLACKTARRIPAPPVLDDISAEPIINPIVWPGSPPQVTENVASSSVETMAIDTPEVETTMDVIKIINHRKKKKRPAPRIPPLFERKGAGHVVFRGNERLVDEDAN